MTSPERRSPGARHPFRIADQRRRFRWVIYGSIIGLTLQTWGTIGLLANVGTAIVPFSIAYAVLNHRTGVVARRQPSGSHVHE